jgi:hypothetical protein
MNLWKMLCLATLTALLLAQSGAAETAVNDAALGKEADGSNWLSYGRTYSEQRFSPLDQVNRETVKRLGLSWFLELPEDRSLIGTPPAATARRGLSMPRPESSCGNTTRKPSSTWVTRCASAGIRAAVSLFGTAKW